MKKENILLQEGVWETILLILKNVPVSATIPQSYELWSAIQKAEIKKVED